MSETQILASYVVNGQLADIPAEVLHEARRALVNFLGCAARRRARRGGGRRPARVPRRSPVAPTAPVLGRDERLDPLHASLMNGISSHVYDYDDTTPKNYCHPTSPIASALFAYASVNPVRGRDFMEAFVYGFEAVVARRQLPSTRRTTTSAGTSPARPASSAPPRPSASCCGLNERQMIWAIGPGRHAGGRRARDVRLDGQVASIPAGRRRTATARRCWRRRGSRRARASSRARAASRR